MAATGPSQSAVHKAPPHSIEAERLLLGGLMLDQNAWDLVADLTSEGDFYDKAHGIIWRAVAHLVERNQNVDVLTVIETLKSLKQLSQANGEKYILELANKTPAAVNVASYARIIHEHAVLRQLISCGQSIAELGFNTEGRESDELIDEAESKLFAISEQNDSGDGPVDISRVLKETTERIDEMYHSDGDLTGLSTGFTDLDKMTGGLQKSDLVIVAGRPSMGKTVFAVNVAETVAIGQDLPVVVFSLEMPSQAIVMRMLSSLGRINQQRLRTGKLNDDDWPRVSSAVGMVSKAKMFIDDTPALSPMEMRSRVRRIIRNHGPVGLVVVDYLQLMRVPGYRENRTNEISEISRSLKALAKEINAPVLALSQLNRSLEQRQDRRPVMSDLRESGAIEQDADLVAFIYRDEVYNEQSPDKGTAEIIIGKQRNGPIGKVRLTFLGEFTKFENFASDSFFAD